MYVDDTVGTVQTSVSGLTTRVGKVETSVAGKQDTLTAEQLNAVNSGITTTKVQAYDGYAAQIAGKQDAALITSANYGENTTSDTSYPSVKAVADAITTATNDIASNEALGALSDRVDTVESDITSLESNKADKTELAGYATTTALAAKQDANMGAEAANQIVTTDGTGKITTAAKIDTSKVSGLSEVATSGSYNDLSDQPTLGTLAAMNTVGSTQIDNNAVTSDKIAAGAVTAGKIAAGAITNADISATANIDQSKINGLTNALAGKVDDADIANMQTTGNLVNTAGWETGKSSDTKYPSAAAVDAAITAATEGIASNDALEALDTRVTTAEGEIDTLGTTVAGKADKATTLAGYGITDAYTTTAADAAFIPRPGTNCTATGAKCVLVTNGTAFEWEEIARGSSES